MEEITMPKQLYEGRGTDLVSALDGLYKAVFGEKAPQQGEEMRYRVDLVSHDQKKHYSSGVQQTYEQALNAAHQNVTDVTQGPPYTMEVFVTGKYDVQRQPEQPRTSGAAPSERRTRDITGLL